MSEPIDPDDIRVGDTVECVERTVVHVVRVDSFGVTGTTDDGLLTFAKEVPRLWELISRPAPKPQVGQHWLDPLDNEEYVVAMRLMGAWFVPLELSGMGRSAEVAPARWALKS